MTQFASLTGPQRLSNSVVARRFMLSNAAVVAAGFGMAWLFKVVTPPVTVSEHIRLPGALQFGTLCLASGSALLHYARIMVRQERQAAFRQCLLAAIGISILFVGAQSFGLYRLLKGTADTTQTETNAHAFVFMFATLHAMHFVVAQGFLVYVTVRSLSDRYDHEYFWGVTVCAWFWHILGIVWIAILCVFAIVVQVGAG